MRVLVADDEKGIRDSVAEYLRLDAIEVVTAENGLSALRLLNEEDFDVLVMDLKMPGATGIEVLRKLDETGIEIPVIMISAYGDVEDAVEAMKLGAEDYLVKPFETEELKLKTVKAGERNSLKKEVKRLREQSKNGIDFKTENSEMKSLLRLAEKAAPTPSNILITGESGTGKEVLANYIHERSGRAEMPFIAVNIGSVPETLLESELFGHEKGAFTGADRMRTGYFEAAAGGTVFLDEIGDMPQHLQVKLLRTIQERYIQRVGSTGKIQLDVRIIAATNRDLERDVESGEFREDLFYRLNVVRLHIPALRNRIEDLPMLCSSLIIKMNKRFNRDVKGITSEALARLRSYGFPGNIRELENLIERAFIVSEKDELELSDFSLPEILNKEQRGMSVSSTGKTLKQLEKEAISNSLNRWEGRRQKAAEELGIDRKTLFNKIKEYKLDL